MVNLLVAAVALASSTPPEPSYVTATQSAEPAMFVVRDADTTIFVFGTFHALDGRTDWFNGEVREAFEQSEELVLETIVPDAPALIPAPATAPTSFLASTRNAIRAGRSQGMSVDKGADMILHRAAAETGKQVWGLETLESQLAMFVRMPTRAAASARAPAPAPVTDASAAMNEMQAAWKSGKQQVFARILEQLRSNSPDTYRMMFAERNSRWADWVAGRMQYPGTVFLAVGAGHLAGRDSLLVRLAEQGMPSTRVN